MYWQTQPFLGILEVMKKLPAYLIFVLTFFASSVISYKIFASGEGKLTPVSTENSETEVKSIPKENFNLEKTRNILLLGYGGAGHDGGNLSDVIMFLNLDSENKSVTFVTIPRDLWVEIPIRSDISENYKINAAYAIGGDDIKYGLKEPQYKGATGAGNMAKKVASDTLGLKVNNFISVDFESFKKIVDILGGLEVDAPVTFNDYFYPVKGLQNETCGYSAEKIAEFHQKYSGFELEKQFLCRYEHLKFEKGVQKMDGEMALKFVRSRHSSEHGGDFARSQRQKAVLFAMKDKLLSLYAVKHAKGLFEEFRDLISTDFDLATIEAISKLVVNPGEYNVKFVSLTEDNVLMATKSMNGQFILIPKEGENVWVNVQKFVYDEINKY